MKPKERATQNQGPGRVPASALTNRETKSQSFRDLPKVSFYASSEVWLSPGLSDSKSPASSHSVLWGLFGSGEWWWSCRLWGSEQNMGWQVDRIFWQTYLRTYLMPNLVLGAGHPGKQVYMVCPSPLRRQSGAQTEV